MLVKKLTSRQREILNFINEEVMRKNYPPSVREICKKMGLSSSSTVHVHLRALEKKGFIKRDPTKPRAIEILDQPGSISEKKRKTKLIPLVGQVTAGIPVFAEENIEGYLALPEEVAKGDSVFLLRVRGDSMKNAGILNDDLVVVRQQPSAENGEIVVALLGDEATVKRFYLEKGSIRLQPENPDYEPLISKDVRLLGKVIGLVRIIG